MLPICKILDNAVIYESNIKAYRKRKIGAKVNATARSLIKSDRISKADETDDNATYNCIDSDGEEFVVSIDRNDCECSDCNTCTCVEPKTQFLFGFSVFHKNFGFCLDFTDYCLDLP